MEEVRTRIKPWLNGLLFVLTVLSAFFVGVTWSLSFKYGDALPADKSINFFGPQILKDPQVIGLAAIYAVVLIAILLGHELGHYLTCRHYKIQATLPFFIPAPTLIGTLGAFIKIKSPITRKKELFDIGAAGPLAGFFLAVPALIIGLSLSKAVPPLATEESLVFGEPLLLRIIGSLLFKDIPAGYDILLHPVGFAGWVGILVTAFNLFPVGQLDGGHIMFALMGRKSRLLSRFFLSLFVVLGVIFWVGWLIWALVILLLGLKHPRVLDEDIPLDPRRKAVAVLMAAIFIFSFIPDPIKGMNLVHILKKFGL